MVILIYIFFDDKKVMEELDFPDYWPVKFWVISNTSFSVG